MKLSKLVVTAALAAGAMTLASGTAYAQPDTSTDNGDIDYSVTVEDRAIVTTIDAGVFKVADDGQTVDVLDAADNTLVTLPLTFNLGDLNFPYEQNIDDDGKTLRLVPNMDLSQASLRSSDLGTSAVASPEENLKAQQNFGSQLGIATAVGGLTGTIIGAVVGGLGFLGGPAGLVSVPFGATIGGIVGTIAAGGPTLIVAGIDLINTLNAPPGTTMWAN